MPNVIWFDLDLGMGCWTGDDAVDCLTQEDWRVVWTFVVEVLKKENGVVKIHSSDDDVVLGGIRTPTQDAHHVPVLTSLLAVNPRKTIHDLTISCASMGSAAIDDLSDALQHYRADRLRLLLDWVSRLIDRTERGLSNVKALMLDMHGYSDDRPRPAIRGGRADMWRNIMQHGTDGILHVNVFPDVWENRSVMFATQT